MKPQIKNKWTPKSTILKCLVLSVPKSCTGLFLIWYPNYSRCLKFQIPDADIMIISLSSIHQTSKVYFHDGMLQKCFVSRVLCFFSIIHNMRGGIYTRRGRCRLTTEAQTWGSSTSFITFIFPSPLSEVEHRAQWCSCSDFKSCKGNHNNSKFYLRFCYSVRRYR